MEHSYYCELSNLIGHFEGSKFHSHLVQVVYV